MKKIITTVVFAVVTILSFADKGIVVTQEYFDANAKGAKVNVTWYVTASQCKMKMEFSDVKVNTVNWFIPDASTNNLLMYAEGAVPSGAQKTFFSIPVQNIKADMNASRVSVNTTGETKTVSGMLCEKIIVKTNKSITEMWVTKDFKPDYYKFYPFFQNSFELMGLSEEKIQGFPLSSVTKGNTGKVISSCDLISVTSSELTESVFTVPAEYKSAEEISKGKK